MRLEWMIEFALQLRYIVLTLMVQCSRERLTSLAKLLLLRSSIFMLHHPNQGSKLVLYIKGMECLIIMGEVNFRQCSVDAGVHMQGQGLSMTLL
ncbi:hypothetical protein T08_6137 [Trichinella sp. T8]|nr:hypothetical protein T08_6137 [Trichinella sp. T8]